MTNGEGNKDSDLWLESVLAHLDGTIDDDGRQELDEKLASDPEAATKFLELASLEITLQHLHHRDRIEACATELLSVAGLAPVDECSDAESLTDQSSLRITPGSRQGGRPVAHWAVGLACALLVGLGFAWLRADRGAADEASQRIARVTSSLDSLWGVDQAPDAEGWLRGGVTHLKRGQAELEFAQGIRIVLEAPAEFEVLSPSEMRLSQGKMAARVDGPAKDFRVFTPMAEVIDLGTEFGVSVDQQGDTAIAVFDGKVDVSPEADRRTDRAGQTVKRLNAGEGLLLDRLGTQRRIRSVEDDTFPPLTPTRRPTPSTAPPLIAGIRDNLRDEDSPKFYRVVRGGLREDALAYVDRDHQWNGVDQSGIPAELRDADYVMTFNDDKAADQFEVVLSVGRPARVYVLFDDRGAMPKWLTSGFVDTGLDLGVDEGPTSGHPEYDIAVGPGESVEHVFSVWSRDVVTPGDVVLGPRFGGRSRSMYGIAVVPLQPVEAD